MFYPKMYYMVSELTILSPVSFGGTGYRQVRF